MNENSIIKGLRIYKNGIFNDFLNSKYVDELKGLSMYCVENNKNKLAYIRNLIEYCYDNGYAMTELGELYSLNRKLLQDNLINLVKYDTDLLKKWQDAGVLNIYKHLKVNNRYHSIILDCIEGNGTILELCNKAGIHVNTVKSYLRNLVLIDEELYERYLDMKYKGISKCNIDKYTKYEDYLSEFLDTKGIKLSNWCRNKGVDYIDFISYIHNVLGRSNSSLYDAYKRHKLRNELNITHKEGL